MDEKRQKEQWKRLEAVILWSNMTTNYFARHIGLSRGENLYQIKRGNNGISLKLAERITSFFPEIDKLWLLTGEGEMFTTAHTKIKTIPFFDLDVERLPQSIDSLERSASMVIPMIDCDFAAIYRGAAIGTELPTNTLVLLKQIEIEEIKGGKLHLVFTEERAYLRRAALDDKEQCVRLEATLGYGSTEIKIPFDKVVKAYTVCGRLLQS